MRSCILSLRSGTDLTHYGNLERDSCSVRGPERGGDWDFFDYRVTDGFPGTDDLGLTMRRSLAHLGFSCAMLVVTSCAAKPQQQTITPELASTATRVVLVQSAFDLKQGGERRPDWNEAARMRAVGQLKVRSAESGFTFVATDPNIDEI